MTRSSILFLLALALIGCSQNASRPTLTPAPTPAPTTAIVVATSEPTLTPLPPTPTSEATEVPAATDTPAPMATVTATVTPTATRTRAAVPPAPRATATHTAVALKYGVPTLIEPGAPGSRDSRIIGKDDLLLKWSPVANLGPKECYAVTVRVVNLVDPSQRYGQVTFLAANTCNSMMSGGPLTFAVTRRGPQNYSGLVAIASQVTPSNSYQARWWVTVVQDNGPDPKNPGSELMTPLSPPSAQFAFSLVSP